MKFVVLFLVIFSSSLWAFPSKEFATFYGGFNRIMRWTSQKSKVEKLKIPSLNKEIPYYLSMVQEKAPVIVIYPGVFGEPDHPMVLHMIEEFEQLPVHVIALPNILAATYLGVRNSTKNNPWEEERLQQKEIFQTVLNLIPQDKIESINLFAESLGTWQSIMILSHEDLKINSATFIWPPLELPKSLKNFDTLIKEKKSQYEACTYWYKWPYALYRYTRPEIPHDLTKEEDDCYGSFIISKQFVNSIGKVAKKAYKIKNQKLETVPETFADFTKSQAQDLLPMLDHDQHLYFKNWIPMIKNRKIKTQFYSSIDDFLNQPSDWDLLKNDDYFKNQIVLYPWGGHSGRAFEAQFWSDVKTQLKKMF
jgi:hypothetical protein